MTGATQTHTFWGGHGHATHDMADNVLVGDRLIPREIFVHVRGGTAQPDLEMKIEVRQDIPECVELTWRARPDGPEVRDKDLAAVRVGDLLERIVAMCSMKRSGSGFAKLPPGEDETALRDITRIRARRRRISQEHLMRVAEIYREHFDDRPVMAVQRAFGVGHRTAARYVQEARRRELLPPTIPGKKKA